MATFDEIAEKHASRIRSAARRDKAAGKVVLAEDAHTKTASAKAQIIAESSLAWALKEVEEDLTTGLTIDDRALTDEEQGRLVDLTAERLGVKDPRKLRIMMKEASNDHFVALVAYWHDFWTEVGL